MIPPSFCEGDLEGGAYVSIARSLLTFSTELGEGDM